jgi:UDP-N-acetyl-D-mannosaminuronate dehydrogenase
MGSIVAASQISLLGVSYREDVGDTRYSGSEIIIRKLTEMGADVKAHDPYVRHWWELEKQDSYPGSGLSWSRFFRNQEHLDEFRMTRDLAKCLEGSDAVIFAVRHAHYLELTPEEVVEMIGGPAAIVDCFGILDDHKIERYFDLGCEVKGLGRGHINRIKDRVRKRKMGAA